MSDEQNPYRFSGAASEEIAPPQELPRRSTLRDLRGISRGRRLLATFLASLAGGFLFTSVTIALTPSPHVHPSLVVARYYDAALAGSVAVLIAMVGLFVVGTKMVYLLARRFGTLEIAALFFAGPNAIVALLLMRDAKRTLGDRGVRTGWLWDDFSQAREDGSHGRSRDR